MRSSLVLSVTESSQVGEARRVASSLAEGAGFDETGRGKIATIVTEAGNNLVKHATGGELVLRLLREGDRSGLEVLALDKGPGMRNVAECMRDGYSTAGTPGTGLGAIERQSGYFDVYSAPASGTVLVSRLWAQPRATARPGDGRLAVGVVSLPHPKESVCGDAWAVDERAERTLLLVADGLGHGPLAAEASEEAVRLFRENVQRSPADILSAVHAGLRATRGAAVAVAEIDAVKETVRFAGLGNIMGAIASFDDTKHMVSHNGTTGHQAHKIQEFLYPFPHGSLAIMASDGITTQWRLDRYPGIFSHDPSVVAGVLYRDYCRGRDDVTVLAAGRRKDGQ